MITIKPGKIYSFRYSEGLIVSQRQRSILVPISSCAARCDRFEIKVFTDGDKCCYNCSRCTDTQFKRNEHMCQECLNGTWPKPDRSSCEPLPLDTVQMLSSYGVVCMVIAVAGKLSLNFIQQCTNYYSK